MDKLINYLQKYISCNLSGGGGCENGSNYIPNSVLATVSNDKKIFWLGGSHPRMYYSILAMLD